VVEFSNDALEDLKDIRAHIALYNPKLAHSKALQIIEKCRALDALPKRGRPGRVSGTREITVKPWVVVYEITVIGPIILHIWHGRQSRAI
jgi:toxin ParE1/3/4